MAVSYCCCDFILKLPLFHSPLCCWFSCNCPLYYIMVRSVMPLVGGGAGGFPPPSLPKMKRAFRHLLTSILNAFCFLSEICIFRAINHASVVCVVPSSPVPGFRRFSLFSLHLLLAVVVVGFVFATSTFNPAIDDGF